jgi:hypothetical protein
MLWELIVDHVTVAEEYRVCFVVPSTSATVYIQSEHGIEKVLIALSNFFMPSL